MWTGHLWSTPTFKCPFTSIELILCFFYRHSYKLWGACCCLVLFPTSRIPLNEAIWILSRSGSWHPALRLHFFSFPRTEWCWTKELISDLFHYNSSLLRHSTCLLALRDLTKCTPMNWLLGLPYSRSIGCQNLTAFTSCHCIFSFSSLQMYLFTTAWSSSDWISEWGYDSSQTEWRPIMQWPVHSFPWKYFWYYLVSIL